MCCQSSISPSKLSSGSLGANINNNNIIPIPPEIAFVPYEMEVKCVANHLVHGFDIRDPVTQRPTVYEFHGCLWHGCPRCFPKDRDTFPIIHADRTLQEVYECTKRKHDQLQQQGYDVKVQWECDWDKEVKKINGYNNFSAPSR